MKKNSFIGFLILFSSAGFAACPDLAGVTKICRSTTGQISGNTQQVITQSSVDGVTTYVFNYTTDRTGEEVTKTLIADGKSRREIEVDEDTGISLLTATTVTCGNNTLLSHETAFIDGQFLGIMDVSTVKSGATVTSVYEGLRWGRDVDDTIVCE